MPTSAQGKSAREPDATMTGYILTGKTVRYPTSLAWIEKNDQQQDANSS